MNAFSVRVLLTLLACGYVAVASAQGISDPTRPPPGWMPPDPNAPPPGQLQAAEGAGDVPVQLLLVGKTRRFAIVRGELVGDKTTGTKIVGVKSNEVIVQSDRGRETLNLFPDVQKTPPRKQPGMGNKDKK